MTSKDLNLMLISLLPEIEPLYREEVSWQEGDETGSHVVFEDVLVPYIKNCAKIGDKMHLSKCLNVIEQILSFNEEYAEEVIALSVLESLLFSDELNADIYKLFGTKTQKLYDEVKEWWSDKRKK